MASQNLGINVSEERVHRRFPIEIGMPERIDFVGLHYDKKGYRIEIEEYGKENADRFVIDFGPIILAQRSMDEGHYLNMRAVANPNDPPDGPIVIVESSEFLDWFRCETLGVYENRSIVHVAILTQNEWVEVICERLPSISRLT